MNIFIIADIASADLLYARGHSGFYLTMKIEYQLPFCVYVLLSLKDDNLYLGYTTDLARRLDDHFQGRNTSTAPRRPFVLVHCEYYLAKADAERRENYLKTAKGRRVLRLMLQKSLKAAKV